MSNDQVHQIIARMGQALEGETGLGGSLKFDFSSDGSVLIDGKSDPITVTDGSGQDADCTISVDLDTFQKMAKGEIDPTSAFMQGKLRVTGDMALAMKAQPFLAKARS